MQEVSVKFWSLQLDMAIFELIIFSHQIVWKENFGIYISWTIQTLY